MADAAEVFAGITRQPGVTYTALAPNMQGLARARHAMVDEISVFPAASETFSQRNLNQSVADAMAVEGRLHRARTGLRVRAYLSVAFGCPFEGRSPRGGSRTVRATP